MMNDTKRMSTRVAFVDGLVDAANDDSNVCLVSADSLKALRADKFAEQFPKQFFECGIAEQTAVTFGAGLASTGLVPFVGTYAGFLAMRSIEQMRTFVAYPKLNVKFVGLNGGIYGGEREGVTHQVYEDLAILRSIPNFEIVVPCDGPQTKLTVEAMAKRNAPGYIRVGSGEEPIIVGEEMKFELGKARIVEDKGRDMAIFVCGPALRLALETADKLAEEGINIVVVEVHTLKPLDVETISSVLSTVPAAATLEDHNIIGGLGSAVCEVAAEYAPTNIKRLGLKDVFAISGEREELWAHYGFTSEKIISEIKDQLAKI